MITKQETFDKVAKHLLTQGTKCLCKGEPRYYYRKKMCAIGCLIPEKTYSPLMEGLVANSIAEAIKLDGDLGEVLIEARIANNLTLKEEIDAYERWSIRMAYDAKIRDLPKPRIFLDHNLKLVEQLQHIHDGNDPEDWSDLLIDLAKSHKLSYKVVTRLKKCKS